MDFFERLRRVAADIPWGTVASAMAENLGASGESATEILLQLQEWGSHLTKNALRKWPTMVVSPVPCDSPDVSSGRPKPCASYAAVKCDVCGRPCCLAHARLDYLGDAICEVCIGEAKARRRATEFADGGPSQYARPHAGQPREERRRQEKRQEPREEPPAHAGGMTAAQALKVLKLPRSASWSEIKAEYRKLVLKYNADRPQSDAERVRNTERLKKLNAAYAVLKQRHEGKEAA